MNNLTTLVLSDPLSAFTFALLMVTALLLWCPAKRHWWAPGFLLAMGTGWLAGRVTAIGLAWLALLGIVAFGQSVLSLGSERRLGGLILFGVAAFIMTRFIPGFDNWKVVDAVHLSPDALPYTQYFNFNKASVGFILMASQMTLCSSWNDWRQALKVWAITMLLMIPVILGMSLLFGYVHWDPKIPEVLPVFLIANFFFISIPEEMVCRAVLQRTLIQYFGGTWVGDAIAIALTAVIFGLGHLKGGLLFVLLAMVAGLFYGIAFYISKKIETDILCHFTLNTLHLLLFTFPALASAFKF